MRKKTMSSREKEKKKSKQYREADKDAKGGGAHTQYRQKRKLFERENNEKL